MRGLYLIILRSIKEMNLDEKKLNSKSTDRSQQTTGKLAYRDLVTYAKIDLNFHYSPQRCTHDQFIVGRIRIFNVASLSRDYRKGACL